ncbi:MULTISPECIES: copper resistance protein B [Acetobacter]|uniref:Copper resistance protein B n=2 Tax=Acetobacter TaxID=434 RepID=A0AAN1PGW1_9PROT|nr:MULTISPECIES: copper resistance protein B [Acetobacter]ASL40771.1 copper resistance protein CopB [Acetobacter oryzifermentans]AXM99883.1 copper resistance protein B [Acetobacter pomorum]KAA8393426.1 copper resistance protein B [Acetobacter sp. DmW_125124]KAA8394890.1 copper resistance protein B [Acetobacter sp. DmW_125127]KAA8398345.1 copper resistance protein B [Acetobacter sp. DmW_125128]
MKTCFYRQILCRWLLLGMPALLMAFTVIPQAKAASMHHAGMEGMDDMDMGDMDMPAQKPAHPQSSTPAHHSTQSVAPNKNDKPGTSAYPPVTPSAQWPATPPLVPKVHYVQHIHPVMDHNTYFHALLEQFEGRYTPGNSLFRYSGQAWFGTDYNKFWVKSEGLLDGHHRFSDGDHEFFYDRAISTYFDVQAGIRLDVDSGPTRAWGAVGVQGLALYFFDVSATAYFNNTGVAGKLEGSYDFLITNRLILQPQAELNFYSHADPERGVSRGFSDIDAGLRLRYEFKRQIAPYIAVTYAGHYGNTASVARNNTRMAENGPEDLRFTFGIRSWF